MRGVSSPQGIYDAARAGIIVLASFNFSLLDLKVLREQGIAPFKSLLAFIYRAIMLAVIFKAFEIIVNDAGIAIKSVASITGW